MFESIKHLFSRTKPVEHHNKKDSLKIRTLKRLHSVTKKNFGDKFDQLVREFFGEYLGIKNEFTFGDVISTLSKKKIKKTLREKIKLFCETFEAAKFNDGVLTVEEFTTLKQSFEEILREI